jgi:hypothetical protein
MANSILSSFFSKPQFTLKNSDYPLTNLAAGWKIISVHFRFHSTPMRHMLESGTTTVDSRIIRATEVEVILMCPDVNTLSGLQTLVSDRSQRFSIVSRGLFLHSVMLDHEAMQQVPEVLSATPIQLVFKQLLVQNENPVIVAQSADSNVIDRGLAALGSVAKSAGDLYSKVSSSVGGLF